MPIRAAAEARRLPAAAVVAAVLVCVAPGARAASPGPVATPVPVAVPGIPPATPPPALPPPVVPPSLGASPPAGGAVAAPATGAPPAGSAPSIAAPAAQPPPPPRALAPVPTFDAIPAASDHDAVVGHVGIEVRRLDPQPFPLALRPDRGCAMEQTAPCTVEMGVLAARYWWTRNLALDAGVALALGGGSTQGRALDAYLGVGPVLGLTLLLGNWRHLAVGASPEASFVWFKPGGDSTMSTTLVSLRASLEGELHFGFVGVPALSIGLQAGLGFRYESTPDARVWAVGVIGAGSVWGALSNLFVRYYL